MKNGEAQQGSLHRNLTNTLIEIDESPFEFQELVQDRTFAFGCIGEKIIHLRVGELQWRGAVTCDRLLQLEIELLQLNVFQALRSVSRRPEHLNECSQSARTEDEFADVKKHQPNPQTAGIKHLL